MQPRTVSIRPPGAPRSEPAHFGKYRLLGELAVGGMARIYLASFEGPSGFLKPCVVKKVLPDLVKHPDFRHMFANEARVAALLNHPNIVQAFDFGEIDGEYFLALEFVEGASLSDVIRESKRQRVQIGLNLVLQVGISICEALAYAHSAKGPDGQPLELVHRDVTPANILVSASGALKLTDFGVVRASHAQHHSRPEVLKGKLTYLSPEQARCGKLDGRSDLYSLGLVLYELVTGYRPLARPTFGETLLAARDPKIPPPSEVCPTPPQLERILMRVLAPDPDDRYPDARAMQEDLEAFRAERKWHSATSEFEELLRQLFPDGLPNAAPSPLPAQEVPEAVAEDVVELDVESVPDVEEPEEGGLPWRELLLLVLAALTVSGAFWLFVLP